MDEWLNLSVLTGLDLLGSEVIESEGKGNHTVFHPGQLMTSSKHSTWTEDRDLDAKVLLTFSRVYSLSQESTISPHQSGAQQSYRSCVWVDIACSKE